MECVTRTFIQRSAARFDAGNVLSTSRVRSFYLAGAELTIVMISVEIAGRRWGAAVCNDEIRSKIRPDRIPAAPEVDRGKATRRTSEFIYLFDYHDYSTKFNLIY